MRVRLQPPAVFSMVAAVCASLVGCAGPPASREGLPSTALADPELVRFDAAAPEYDFAGFGSVVLGNGWDRAERDVRPATWLAWMLDGRARVEVPSPVRGPATDQGFDFTAEVMPYLWPGRAEQRLSLWLGDRALGDVVLEDGWETVRIPLPDDVLTSSFFTLELRASDVQRPSEVGGSADARALSIAFRRLAVVARGVSRAATVRSVRQEDSLVVPPGGAVAVPLPPGHQVSVALGALRAKRVDCQVDVRFEDPSGETVVLSTGALSAAPSSVVVNTPEGPVGFLTFGWSAVSEAHRCKPLVVPLTGLVTSVPAPRTANPTETQAPPPSIFVYLIDTLRADALAPFGGNPEVSPHAAAFAAEAVTYRRAWSPSAWTLPATLSVLTGVYPDRHGVMTGRLAFDPATVPTLAARLAARGYATAGFSQSLVASPRFGIDVGFGHFEMRDQLNGAQMGSSRLRRRLLRWLATRSASDTEPIFAYLHSVDPHAPYVPVGADRRFAEQDRGTLGEKRYHPNTFHREELGGNPLDVAHLRGLYEGEVAFADRQLGRFLQLLRHLGLYERSVIVVLSDHGEEFREHGGFGHGRTLFEEQLRVPLMIKYPRARWAGQTIDRPVSTVDLVPTLLAIAASGDDDDRAVGTGFDGRSLLPPDLAAPEPRPLLGLVAPYPAEGFAGVDYRAFRLGDLKCIESRGETDQFGQPAPAWQTFDLAVDPGERQPLESGDRRAIRCRRLLERWMAQRADVSAVPTTGDAIDEETLEQLRALGYLGG